MPRSCAFVSALCFQGCFPFVLLLPIVLSLLLFSEALPRNSGFRSDIMLLGDAKFTHNGSSVQLTDPRISSPSSGFMIQKRSIQLFTSNSKPISFSTDFTFSIAPHNGTGLTFLILPRSFLSSFSSEGFVALQKSRFLGVEFDENLGDVNAANHVGSPTISAKTSSNLSSINLVLQSGVKFHSWIDYDANSKRIEVRLMKFGNVRPHIPLLVYQVDLMDMLGSEEVLVCLRSSTSRDSMESSSVYSWNFWIRNVPYWLHSKPVDVVAISNEHKHGKTSQKRKICLLSILCGFVFITGCGALIMLFIWALLGNNSKTVISPKFSDFHYEKINVVLGADD